MKIKKTIALLLCAVLLFSAFGGTAFAALQGDVNGDGKVGLEDARAILRASLSLDSVDGATAALMDINRDGALTVGDARLALRMACRLDPTVEYQPQESLRTRLPKTITVYEINYETGDWYKKETRDYTYENGYPVSISTYDFNAEEGRTVTFAYEFEDGVPTVRKDFDPDGFQTAEIEYNAGRIYKIDKMNSDGLYHGTQYFQFANRDDYFTFVLHENHYAASEENPGMTMEETDSISVVTENGLLRSTTNTGMYANWSDGEEKVWQRFSGTYAASYDADGILTQTDAYHRVGPSGTENKFGLTKENGCVVEAIRLWKNYETGEWTGETKFEFEYTDIETTPARFAAMINCTILGETNNYYYYFWY